MNETQKAALNNMLFFAMRQDYVRAAFWLGRSGVEPKGNTAEPALQLLGATYHALNGAFLTGLRAWVASLSVQDYASTLPQVKG